MDCVFIVLLLQLLNGHQDNRKTRSKYSTRLAKLAERSAPSSPRVPSRGPERCDPKNTEENVINVISPNFIYVFSDVIINH